MRRCGRSFCFDSSLRAAVGGGCLRAFEICREYGIENAKDENENILEKSMKDNNVSGTVAQTDNLTLKIENVLKAKNARIGVAIFNSNEKDTFKINNDFHFPMQKL